MLKQLLVFPTEILAQFPILLLRVFSIELQHILLHMQTKMNSENTFKQENRTNYSRS